MQQKAILKTKYESWKKNEITAVEFMNKMDLKKNSFYKIMKEYEVDLIIY